MKDHFAPFLQCYIARFLRNVSSPRRVFTEKLCYWNSEFAIINMYDEKKIKLYDEK